MSFTDRFRRLLKKDEPAQASAEVVEKRRSTRIDIAASEVVPVEVVGAAQQRVTGHLVNLSVRGCRIITDTAIPEWVIAKSRLELRVSISKVAVVLVADVVWRGGSEAAFEFRGPFPQDFGRIENFLEPRTLGASLREINPQVLQGKDQGLRWFQGTNDTNLFCWTDASGEITQQQLIFHDVVVECGREGQVKTGHIRYDTPSNFGGLGWVKAELLDFDTAPSPEILAQASVLLEAATLEDKVKSFFLKNLNQ